MRKIEVMLYEFSELSEAAKEKAIERFRYLNVDYEWWSCSFDGVAECGIVIHEFDMYSGKIRSVIDDKYETAKTVISDWGETMGLHVLSKQFMLDRDALVEKYGDDADLDNLESEYHHDIDQEMIKMLREEYDYLTSDEAVIESIEINNYEFTEDGTLA